VVKGAIITVCDEIFIDVAVAIVVFEVTEFGSRLRSLTDKALGTQTHRCAVAATDSLRDDLAGLAFVDGIIDEKIAVIVHAIAGFRYCLERITICPSHLGVAGFESVAGSQVVLFRAAALTSIDIQVAVARTRRRLAIHAVFLSGSILGAPKSVRAVLCRFAGKCAATAICKVKADPIRALCVADARSAEFLDPRHAQKDDVGATRHALAIPSIGTINIARFCAYVAAGALDAIPRIAIHVAVARCTKRSWVRHSAIRD
jgi:hypothetical protein